ncbi:GATA transcription factor [Melia azedarach]|uniref:GATA transcription factor n=1 Tax=Melia azedarach TaxID=155640 RepID=A0ACC1YW95_MELAZ|nr:GATA transcription factor [Melia azedarach]
MDVKRKGSETEEVKRSPFNEIKKSCIDCRTTRTPLWRSGPAGPRSLCNACGIRYRKTKRALSGLDKRGAEKRKRSKNKHVVTVKMGMMAASAGREMALQKSLEEEEEAARLLMSLSYGYVYA